MILRKFVYGILMILICTSFLSCASSVSLTRSWNYNDNNSALHKNILVVGMAEKQKFRSDFEFQLKHEFNSKGIRAMTSVDGLPKGIELDKETYKQYFSDDNIDAVLVTGLVSIDTIEKYQPGEVYARPVAHYRTWHRYRRTVYALYSEPGYWTQDTEYVFESNFYDVASGELIWRGVSKAVNPDYSIDVFEDLSKGLVSRLIKDGIVASSEAK